MVTRDVKKLGHGLYRLYWKGGGTSLAAVGVTHDGGRWMAPINWIAPGTDGCGRHWRQVERAEPITTDD